MKKKIAVLGAGPTGLSAAWKLLQQDFEVDVIEKENIVGGLSASIKKHNYTVDYGPHNFHVKRGEPQPLIKSIYDHELQIIERKTRMLLNGKTYSYPFKIFELLFGLGPILSLKIIASYTATQLKNKISPHPSGSFEDWGTSQFGKVLYDLCFGAYSAKVWGVSPTQLSASLAKQKVVNKLSLMNFIKNMLGINRDTDQFTHYQQLVYPAKGSGHFFEEIAKVIQNMRGKIHLNTKIDRIVLKDDSVHSICLQKDGIRKEIEYTGIISSIPLYSLINLISPEPPQEIAESAKRLKYRALILVYLIVDKEFATEAQMIYLLDKKFRCNRITEQKHFNRATIPDNKTVLTFERCCNKGDELWNASDAELYEMVLKEVEYLSQYFRKDQIKDYFVVKLENAYPVFALNYETDLADTLRYIFDVKNLMTAGRNGLFLNNDMHDCMVIGIKTAQGMINKLR